MYITNDMKLQNIIAGTPLVHIPTPILHYEACFV